MATGCGDGPALPDRAAPRGRRRGRPLRAARRAALCEGLARYGLESERLEALSGVTGVTGGAMGAEGEGGVLQPGELFAPTRLKGFALEIGFGAGEHLVAAAAAEPETGFFGAEVYENGLAACADAALAADLANLRLYPGDGRRLLALFAPASLDAVYALFPDPWPKRRHRKRRLLQGAFLGLLATRLRPGGRLFFASDDPAYQGRRPDRRSRPRRLRLACRFRPEPPPPCGGPDAEALRRATRPRRAGRAGRPSIWTSAASRGAPGEGEGGARARARPGPLRSPSSLQP